MVEAWRLSLERLDADGQILSYRTLVWFVRWRGWMHLLPASLPPLPSLPARLLCTMDDLHPTRKGIFSMDSCGARVATGSKDSTVSVASLRPTGLACDRWASQSPLI